MNLIARDREVGRRRRRGECYRPMDLHGYLNGQVWSRPGEMSCIVVHYRRISWHAGMMQINFQCYMTKQLEKIPQAMREGGDGEATRDVIGLDAIKFASMKASRISGGVRKSLDIQSQTEVKEVIQLIPNTSTAAHLWD